MARCPECGQVTVQGCLCQVADSDCFALNGAGTEGSPYIIEPILDPDVDNLLECETGEGLTAELPSSITDPPFVDAFSTVNLSIANDTLTVVAMNSEKEDTDTMHNPSSNNSRVTFTTTGTYLITLNATWNKNATGIRLAQIRKNGSDVLGMESKKAGGSDLYVGHSITVIDQFTATDYVEAQVRQTSGGSLIITSESYSPFLTAVKL